VRRGEGVSGSPFIWSEGEWGSRTGRGIRRLVVGRHYGPSGSVRSRNRGGEWGVKRGGGRARAAPIPGEEWTPGWHAPARRGGGSCVRSASSWGRRKPGGTHTVVRREGGGGLG
jgi:hypothetical protein